jgi:multiple sugar transport system ATP-binding protein
MAHVSLKNLYKTWNSGDSYTVKNLSLEIKDKEFCVFVGPSGCGKSTTLRMVAGLETISSGTIAIGSRVVNEIPAKDRNIAMVFQNYALYPHMTAYENMAFALKLRNYSKSEIDKRIKEAAVILSIEHLLDRKPKQLSGGERQRVALGRAIVRKPDVFLFDEPLSNLDAKMRVQMRTELYKLHQRLQTTMIYVTHDQIEAMTLGSRIAVMNKGEVQQFAEPLKIYDNPANKFVAGFIGSPAMNFMEGVVVSKANKLYFDEGDFKVKIDEKMYDALKPYVNKEVIFGVRPECVYDRLFATNASPDNTVRVVCDVVEAMGSANHIFLKTKKSTFIAIVDAHDRPTTGEYLEVVFDMARAHFFDKDTEVTII